MSQRYSEGDAVDTYLLNRPQACPGFTELMELTGVEAAELLQWVGETVVFQGGGLSRVTVSVYFEHPYHEWENDLAVVFHADEKVVHAARQHDGKFSLVCWHNSPGTEAKYAGLCFKP